MNNRYTVLFAECIASGASIEQALASLRVEGASPVEAIKAIHVFQNVSLAEAKNIFGLSQAWSLEVARGDALHAEIISKLKMTKTN
jgi:hypothetical protein